MNEVKPVAQTIVNYIDEIPWYLWGAVGIIGGLGALRLMLQGIGWAK